jgi:hypothetical protein
VQIGNLLAFFAALQLDTNAKAGTHGCPIWMDVGMGALYALA